MLSRFCCCQSPSYIFGLKKPAAKAGSGSAAREIRRTLLHPLSDRGSFAEWSWLHWARSCMGQALKGPKLQAHVFALRAQGGVVTSCQDLAVISHHQNKPSQLSQTSTCTACTQDVESAGGGLAKSLHGAPQGQTVREHGCRTQM